MNMAQPDVPISQGMGTRPPWVRRRYPPWPLRIRSAEPRRSNCGPPSPSPSTGPSPGSNASEPVCASTRSRCTSRPSSASIRIVRGLPETVTREPPQATTRGSASDVRRRIGAPQSSRTSDPSAGIGCGRPPSIAATLIRMIDEPMGVTLTSTALPAIFNRSSSAAPIRAGEE